MRLKLNVTLVLALLGLFSVATACGDDGSGSNGNGEAGEAGESAGGSAGAMSTAGSANGGKAGSSPGVGGEPSSNGGNPPSNGGESGSPNTSGNGGESGSGGEGGGDTGGEGGGGTGSGGEGGSGTGSGGEGGGGPVTCTEITLDQFTPIVADGYARYDAPFTPDILGSGADSFRFLVMGPPYDGDASGTFDLTENGDDNYQTCARCLFVIAGPDDTMYFQSEGTLVIDDASTQLYGTIDATVTNLKLVEVTVASDATSTPVPGGGCLTIASAAIEAQAPPCEGFVCENGQCIANPDWQCDDAPDCDDASDEAPANPLCVVPEGWLCPEVYVGDGDCDCGCGAKDTDCTSTTDESECDYCLACASGPCPPNTVDPEDTTSCL